MPRDTVRDIRSSVRARVSSLFSSPPPASGLNAYTVYSDADLRAVQAGVLKPVYPCVFIDDAGMRPAKIVLPFIAVELIVSNTPFELGRDGGLMFMCSLHVFGRQLNEASGLAYHLMKNLRPFNLYDYSNPALPVLRETPLMWPTNNGSLVEISMGPKPNESERESSAYEFWQIVTFRCKIRDD